MPENLTTAVLRHARWSPPVQRHLVTSAARTRVLGNRHLDPDLVRELAADLDWDDLETLTRAQGGDLAGLGPCRDRAAALAERDGLDLPDVLRGLATLTGAALDDAVATALAHAADEGTARRVGATLTGPVGPSTAAVLLFLGVDPARHAANGYFLPLLEWLYTPAGAALTDAQVAALLCRHWDRRQEQDADLLTPLLVLRPGLVDLRLPDWATSAVRVARAREKALTAAGPDPGARDALLSRNLTEWRAHRSSAALWALARFALAGSLRDAQRAVLTPQLTGQGLLSELELRPLAGPLRQALGVPGPAPARSAGWQDWQDVQHTFGVREVQLAWLLASEKGRPRRVRPATAVPDLNERDAPLVAAWLGRALAEDDPAREAARWAVAAAVLGSFAGTLAELAAVTAQVTARATAS